MLKKSLLTGSRFSAAVRQASPKDSWAFTYIGGNLEREALPISADESDPLGVEIPESSAFPLSKAEVGDRLCVTQMQGRCAAIRALQSNGLCCGAKIRVDSRQASGSVVVTVGGARLGLGAAVARQVMVSSASTSC